MSPRPLHVAVVGPGPDVKGGVSSVIRLTRDHWTSADVRLRWVASHTDRTTWRKAVRFTAAGLELAGLLATRRVDLVHLHFASRGSTVRKFALLTLAAMFRVPIVLHAHGAEFHQFYGGLPGFVRGLIRAGMAKSARLIVLSESWATFYRTQLQVSATQAHVLANPVRLPDAIPDRTDRPTATYLFLGRIGERKGAYDLIRAFAALPKDARARTRLVMAGDGDVEGARSLATELGLDDIVSVRGWVSPDERDALLATADVYVLPSYNEGLPMSILEAMSWALPIVSCPVGGVPDLVKPGENGHLVAPGQVDDLAGAIAHLAAHASERQAMGARSREAASAYDISRYVDQLAQLYRAVVTP